MKIKKEKVTFDQVKQKTSELWALVDKLEEDQSDIASWVCVEIAVAGSCSRIESLGILEEAKLRIAMSDSEESDEPPIVEVYKGYNILKVDCIECHDTVYRLQGVKDLVVCGNDPSGFVEFPTLVEAKQFIDKKEIK